MKRLVALFLAVLMLAAVGAGCAVEKPVIRLSEVTHSVFYAPQYVAISQGFFADEGLNLELINGGGADKVMTAVLSGQVEIGLAGPEASIYVFNENKDDYCKIFSSLTKRDGSFIVGRVDEDFKWENLKDKDIIGGRKGGMPEMTLEHVIRTHGMNPATDMRIDTGIAFPMMAGAFTGGQGDYVALFEPVASAVELEGKGVVLASVGAESGEIPYTAYFAKSSYIEKNPAVIEKFTRAIYRGQRWVATHTPEEIADAIIDFFPDTGREILISVAKRYKEIDAWYQTPEMSEEAFARLQTVITEAGELSKTVAFTDIVDTRWAKKVID